MKTLLAVLALAVLTTSAWAAPYNSPPKTLLSSTVLGAGGSGTEYTSTTNGLSIPYVTYAVIAVLATFADSASADSAAFETFLLADLGSSVDSSGFAPIDMDDSRPGLDGWLCTTLDSTRLVLPGNLTPITGAASTEPKYPYGVSSRVVYGAPQLTASGVAVPGISNVVFGPRGNTKSRWFFLVVSDAFGGAIRGANKVGIGVLNRHPRIGFTARAWLLASEN